MNTKLISSLVKGLTFTPAFFGSQCCGKTVIYFFLPADFRAKYLRKMPHIHFV